MNINTEKERRLRRKLADRMRGGKRKKEKEGENIAGTENEKQGRKIKISIEIGREGKKEGGKGKRKGRKEYCRN